MPVEPNHSKTAGHIDYYADYQQIFCETYQDIRFTGLVNSKQLVIKVEGENPCAQHYADSLNSLLRNAVKSKGFQQAGADARLLDDHYLIEFKVSNRSATGNTYLDWDKDERIYIMPELLGDWVKELLTYSIAQNVFSEISFDDKLHEALEKYPAMNCEFSYDPDIIPSKISFQNIRKSLQDGLMDAGIVKRLKENPKAVGEIVDYVIAQLMHLPRKNGILNGEEGTLKHMQGQIRHAISVTVTEALENRGVGEREIADAKACIFRAMREAEKAADRKSR